MATKKQKKAAGRSKRNDSAACVVGPESYLRTNPVLKYRHKKYIEESYKERLNMLDVYLDDFIDIEASLR